MVSKETKYFVEQGEGGRLKKIDVETNEGNVQEEIQKSANGIKEIILKEIRNKKLIS
jgi:hypothetical protein